MTALLTLPAYPFETPTEPQSATLFQATPFSTYSSGATKSTTRLSSRVSSLHGSKASVISAPTSPTRIQPPRQGKAYHQYFAYEESRLLALPNEILLMIVEELRNTSSISVLALRYAHPLFYIVCHTNIINVNWHRMPRHIRKEEYILAETCISQGFLRDLFPPVHMPCYRCLNVKGKSCFSRDVREGNLGIGTEEFEQRRCQRCGGSEKEMRTTYLNGISSIWSTDLFAKLPL